MTRCRAAVTLWPMKPTVYLSDPVAMRKVRLNQPRVTSEQLRAQFEAFRLATAKPLKVARRETCSLGHERAGA